MNQSAWRFELRSSCFLAQRVLLAFCSHDSRVAATTGFSFLAAPTISQFSHCQISSVDSPHEILVTDVDRTYPGTPFALSACPRIALRISRIHSTSHGIGAPHVAANHGMVGAGSRPTACQSQLPKASYRDSSWWRLAFSQENPDLLMDLTFIPSLGCGTSIPMNWHPFPFSSLV